MRRHAPSLVLLCGCLVSLTVASTAHAFTVTVIGGVGNTIGQTTVRGNGTPTSRVHNVFPAAYPYAATTDIFSGSSSNTTQYDFSGDAFDVSFDHSRGSGVSESAGSFGDVLFSVDEDVYYEITGAPTRSSMPEAAWLL